MCWKICKIWSTTPRDLRVQTNSTLMFVKFKLWLICMFSCIIFFLQIRWAYLDEENTFWEKCERCCQCTVGCKLVFEDMNSSPLYSPHPMPRLHRIWSSYPSLLLRTIYLAKTVKKADEEEEEDKPKVWELLPHLTPHPDNPFPFHPPPHCPASFMFNFC